MTAALVVALVAFAVAWRFPVQAPAEDVDESSPDVRAFRNRVRR